MKGKKTNHENEYTTKKEIPTENEKFHSKENNVRDLKSK